MPSDASYLTPVAKVVEFGRPQVYVMSANETSHYGECNVKGCSGVENFPWCTPESRDWEYVELLGEQHVRECHDPYTDDRFCGQCRRCHCPDPGCGRWVGLPHVEGCTYSH